MTTIERFQKLQVELVRAGFDTALHVQADGKEDDERAVVAMFVELRKQTGRDIERLDELTGVFGFSYAIGDDSRAAITLAPARA